MSNEQHFGLLIESSPDAIVVYDLEGRVTYVNPAFEETFGWSEAELLHKRLEFIPAGLEAETAEFIKTVLTEGRLPAVNTKRLTKSGRIIDVQLTGALGKDESGKGVSSIVILRDITEQSAAERERELLFESEREQRLMAESLSEVTIALTVHTSLSAVLDEILIQVQRLAPYTTANIALLEDKTLHVVGWRGYDAIGKEDFITNLVQPLETIPLSARAIKTRKPLIISDTHDYQSTIHYEEATWIRSYIGLPLALQERVVGMLRVNSDQPRHFSEQDVLRLTPLAQAAAIAIENARLHEQSQAEIAKRIEAEAELEQRVERRTAQLQQSRQQAATLIQLNPHGIIEWDKDFQVVVWNPGAAQIFGYSEAEAIGQQAGFIVPEEAWPQVEKRWQHLLSQTGETHSVSENVTADGRRIICNWYNLALINADGLVTGLASFVEDITERKQAEAELANRTRLLEILNDLSRKTSFLLELNPLLAQIAHSISELFDVPQVYISDINLTERTTTVLAEYITPETSSSLGQTYHLEDDFGVDIEWLQNIDRAYINVIDAPDTTPQEQSHYEKYGIKAVLGVPLHAQGKIAGLIELYEDRYEREFTEEEIAYLTAIAAQLSVAVDNASLFAQATREIQERQQAEETLSQRLKVEGELAQASQALVTGFENALKEALRHVLKAANASRVALFENFEDAGDGLCTRQIDEICAPGLATQNDSGSRQHISYYKNKLTRWREALEAGQVINSVVTDLREAERNLLTSPETAAFLAIPITVQGNWYGFLGFDELRPDQIWEEQDVQLLQTAASMIGTYIERKQLEQEAQSSLERRNRELQLLTQMAQEIALAPDLPDLYKRFVTIVKEQFGYYHTQLLRYNPTLDVVELIAGYGDVGEKMLSMHHSMPMGVGLIGITAELGQTILSPNIAQDTYWHPNPLLARTKGELVVPIKIGDRVLGVLDVQSDVANELNVNDQILLEGLCGQIAVAIESANLRQEMADRLREVDRLQQIMTREGWQEYHTAEKVSSNGYIFNQEEVRPLIKEAQTNGHSVRAQANGKTLNQPLAVRGTTIGTIGIEDDPERPLSDEDKAFLDAISVQVAEALEMARLLDTTQEALVTQERLSTELRTVAEVSTVTSTIMERDRLLQNVVDLTKTSFNLYHAHLYLINEAGDTLSLVAGADQVGRLMTLEENHVPIRARSIVSRAARTREPVVENDARQSPDFMAHPLLPHTRAELATPMIVGDRLVGVLDVQSDIANRFADQDILIMRTLASQVAVAVQNAEQYAEQVETAEKLREVEQLKSEFLASMSHELRTPLNSIIGFADVLLEGLDGDLNDRMEQDVRLIRDSGDHLRNLIGDILDMSKIEAGKMELRYEEIGLRQLAQDIIATATPMAQEKGLRLHLNLEEDLFDIYADRTRLRQIMWNIMGNAIKFTPKGSVTLAMQTEEANVLISVRDTGIGIMPENIPIVFEQFRQVDGSLNRTAEGTGLGMPITKKLVELHGGEIWVESIFGVGTTFWFTLPRFPNPQNENETM